MIKSLSILAVALAFFALPAMAETPVVERVKPVQLTDVQMDKVVAAVDGRKGQRAAVNGRRGPRASYYF